MIDRASSAAGAVVTFVLDGPAASVVGDFNRWDPAVHPLVAGRVTVALPPGRHTFRYLVEGGEFRDDPDADLIEDNGLGGTHSVLVIEPAVEAIDLRTAAASNGAASGVAPDELQVIVGIGPKIADALAAAGIASLGDLAAANPDQLKGILKSAGVRVAPTLGGWSAEAVKLLNGST